jgi:hypothetical protein
MATMAEVSVITDNHHAHETNEKCRIFRTDYGHSEVAAHFGNGMYYTTIIVPVIP